MDHLELAILQHLFGPFSITLLFSLVREIISPNARRPRLSFKETNSEVAPIPEEDQLQLKCPDIGNTAVDPPTQALLCIGEKIMKMLYAIEGFVNVSCSYDCLGGNDTSIIIGPTDDNKNKGAKRAKKAKKSKAGKADFSYERLEFLGDAILDFTAVVYWLERNKFIDEKTLRKVVAEGVNNNAFGALCIELGLYRSLRHVGLDSEILMGLQAVNGVERTPQYWDRCVIPKEYFANIIESAFGAIFVDSRFNLQATQRLFDKI
ncbi:Dicer-like protein 1, partial [Entomortierella chlamydospora]